MKAQRSSGEWKMARSPDVTCSIRPSKSPFSSRLSAENRNTKAARCGKVWPVGVCGPTLFFLVIVAAILAGLA
jgi:hypothetical protein